MPLAVWSFALPLRFRENPLPMKSLNFTLAVGVLILTVPFARAADASSEEFLARHWSRPLAPQGSAPAKFSAIEASLQPADCGQCHAPQLADWQTSQHSRAMGPGVLGQLLKLAPAARDEHQECLRCHAPLAEQADALTSEIAASVNPTRHPASAVDTAGSGSGLHRHGLTCAGCHVRQQQRFGPPRRDRSGPDAATNPELPHGGFTAAAAFEDSRFCAACHQFESDGFALNGKLLENTYDEWRASRHARESRTCQSCHMPDRRHLWRGIHDPQTVRSGLAFTPGAAVLNGKTVRTSLLVRNTGTGHFFPTYVTPRVIVEIEQLKNDGSPLRGTRVARIIQRRVPLDLSREISDTRLPPDGEMRLDYRQPRARGAAFLAYRLRVEPDEFYARFYRSLLAAAGTGRGTAQIREALRQAEASPFVAFDERRPLAPASP